MTHPHEERIRDYRLLGSLGQGAHGEVFGALHEPLERLVALKVPAVALARAVLGSPRRERCRALAG